VDVTAIAVVCFANACCALLLMRLLALRVQSKPAPTRIGDRWRRRPSDQDHVEASGGLTASLPGTPFVYRGSPNGRQRALAFVPVSEAEVTSTARRPQHAA